MSTHSLSTPPSSFQMGDVYYLLFRHKWKILLCALASFAGAAAYYKLNPPLFQSEAKLFIRFVISESGSTGPTDDDAVRKSPDQRGETILNSELQILLSRDLAETAAKNVGAEKILDGVSDGKSLVEAGSYLRSGLLAEVPLRSSTIVIKYSHPNNEVTQQVLREVIATYLKRHVEIHRAAGMVGDFLAQETDQLRTRLAQTEEELRQANAKAGVVSLEASKEELSSRMKHIRDQLFELQVELAARTSIYEKMTKQQGPSEAAADNLPAPPAERVAEYRALSQRGDQLRNQEQELLKFFTAETPRVQNLREQIAEVDAQRQRLSAEFPGLARVTPAAAPAANGTTVYDAVAEAAQITALQARAKTLALQMEEVRKETTAVEQLEGTILELRRRKELEEANYRRYSASLEQARIKEAMGEGKVSNISIVQSPTPPFRDWMPVRKIAAGIAVSGLALGLGWAFLIEFLLDHSLRRPADVERSLRSPLFISIPRIKLPKSGGQTLALPAPAAGAAGDALALAVQEDAALDPFHQTLRDRLMSYFDSINLRHKPKLVAVTGLGRGSGVTTIAAGLAKTFSETGGGNVLLVDMTQGQGSAQQFHKGSQVDIEQLFSTRNSALVQDNLYVVTEHSGSDRLARGMPQRFNELVPKLKASDFDYIIFDMPPVNQISITPRLAGFMDMTLLVVESEKTDRHVAERAAELLAQSKTNVGVVLNKNKAYVPSKLQQDQEFMLGM